MEVAFSAPISPQELVIMLMIYLLTRLTSLRIHFIMILNSLPLWSSSAMFSGLILTWAGKGFRWLPCLVREHWNQKDEVFR